MAIFSFIARLDNMLGRNLPSSSSVDILTDQSIYGIKIFKNGIVVPDNTLVCAQLSDLSTYLANLNYLTTTSSIPASQLTGLSVITTLSGLSLPTSQLTGKYDAKQLSNLTSINTLSALSLPASQLTGLSVITALSGLSLPSTQVTGYIPASQLTGLSAITALSALSLPASQLTGFLPSPH